MDEKNYITANDELPRGVVYIVGGGPGDPGLITLRGVECLRKAEVVVHDRLVNSQLLAYADDAELIDVGKSPSHHPIPQAQINAVLVEKALQGKIVVRLKGGDPFVFGRGGEEAQALIEAGIPFEIVPGVTSAIAVPAYAGIPVTQRGMATSVAFITGHCAGSHPLELNWQALAQGVDTLVFLMGVSSLPMITACLIKAGRSPATPVALIEKGTLPEQKVVIGTLGTIIEKAAGVQPPSIVIVGEVVSLHEALQWFKPETEMLAL
jgi:uroporphyrin-III C-methyltransferase